MRREMRANPNTYSSRIIGFVLSLILTLAAFFLITRPEYFHLKIDTAVIFVFVLAVVQFIVQSLCFIHIWNEKGTRWNLLVFLSTISIIFIILVGSIWIMNHLDAKMCVHPPREGF